MSLTLVKAWQSAKQRLDAAGLTGPVIDARLLVEAAAEATRADIVADPHRTLTPEQEATLEDYLSRREHREPVSHILGRKGFWKIMLNVTPDVLTPRPDTETVVEYVLRDFPEHAPWSILDLGVGSGAIVLSILAERPAARGLGIDVSEEALAVARDNAAHLGLAGRLALLRSDWTFGLADASLLTPISFLQVLVVGAFGYFLFHEKIDQLTVLGAAMSWRPVGDTVGGL